MIRGSALIAAVAIAISVMVHLMGLTLTTPALPGSETPDTRPDRVAMGNAFEDLVEPVAEPVEPEPAETPEPPEETPPEPERTEPVPITEALVASNDPKPVPSPDTGEAEIVQPEIAEPVQPSVTAEEADGDDKPSADEANSDPIEAETAAKAPQGDPDAIEAAAEPEQLAALPVVPEAAATPPVTAIVPPVQEAVEPEIAALSPIPEAAETVEESEDSELAVTTSIRPRLPDRRPTTERQGVLKGSRDFSDLRFPDQVVDSPLTVYRREGIDRFRQGSGGSRSGGRGPGNSDVTNYAGQVLVHLNRAPVVFVSARGFAQVFFQIDPDGSLAWVEIVDSSGSLEVERAAREQVRRAAPFPRPPSGTSRKLSFFYQNN